MFLNCKINLKMELHEGTYEKHFSFYYFFLEQNKATLKTLHFAVGTICDAVAVKHGKNASKMLIYAINKVAVGSLEALSTDLEHFAKHAKRKVINSGISTFLFWLILEHR